MGVVSPAICDNTMDVEGIVLGEIKQKERGNYCVCTVSLTCGIFKKKKKKRSNSQKERVKKMATRGRGK